METETRTHPRDAQVTRNSGSTSRDVVTAVWRGRGLLGLPGSNGSAHFVPRFPWEPGCLARPALCEQETPGRNTHKSMNKGNPPAHCTHSPPQGHVSGLPLYLEFGCVL